jgi:enoyl-CoA hydratase/carnithine racemase
MGELVVVELRAIDPERDEYLFSDREQARGKSEVLALVDRLAARARQKLAGERGPSIDAPPVARLVTPNLEAYRHYAEALEGTVEALFLHAAPTVALVNGHAIAGGCVLALCCDHRVATADPRARIGLNEVAAGLAFPPRTLAMVRARLSAAQAERAILGAPLHDPAGAREAGLVDEVAEEPRAVALARLEALARHPREAYAIAKRALRAGAMRIGDAEQRAFEAEILPRWASEGTRAAARRLLGR